MNASDNRQNTGGGTLVIQPLPGIGDAIWHLPFIRAIAARAPERRITLLTKRRSMADELLAGCDYISRVLWLERDGGSHDGPFGFWRLGAVLAPYRFDEAWILHGSSRYALAAWRGGIPERIGYGIGWQDAFLTSEHSLSRLDRSLSAIAKARRLLERHAVPIEHPLPNLPIADELRREADAVLAGRGRPAVALAIGSSETYKQWGAANFAQLAHHLHQRHDASIILLGGPGEAELAIEISERLSDADWQQAAIGRPLGQAAALAAAADLCIGNDTGMLNVAAATGTNSIGLFGGGPVLVDDPRIHALVPPGGRVFFGDERMGEITAEAVMAAVDEALAG
ncbi:MAG: glycosyltransferase family 9 protein [Rhodospirillaceae bacterium]|nr:glycosyltransferase family 9 protein [Rhodospirillaceae bacterium]